MDQIIFASLSHTHYWYEVGMLKVPAVDLMGLLSTVDFTLDYDSPKLENDTRTKPNNFYVQSTELHPSPSCVMLLFCLVYLHGG